jgi:hypothetical protein
MTRRRIKADQAARATETAPILRADAPSSRVDAASISIRFESRHHRKTRDRGSPAKTYDP